MVTDALSYPLRGSGILVMIIGTVVAILLQVAAFVPVIGILAAIIFYGYFIAYYYQILQKTATGSDVEPDWPDVSDFLDDMVSPTLQVIGVLIVSNLLWALAIWQTGEESVLSWAAQAFGMFYFPMALLSVIILGNLGGANPVHVIPSIFRTMSTYAVVGFVAVGLSFLVDFIISKLAGNPLVNHGITTLLTLYFITAHARLLGMFYRKEEEKLDWF